MDPSPIASKITEIVDSVIPNHFFKFEGETYLRGYLRGINERRIKVYITAEVHPDCLDTGEDLPNYTIRYCPLHDYVCGDTAAYLIGKELGGGNNGMNRVPINKQLDTTSWKEDERKVYEHVKQGGTARLVYGIEYSKKHDDELKRPFKIYRHFILQNEDGEAIGQPIEGLFVNKSPKYTRKSCRCGCRGYPTEFLEETNEHLIEDPPREPESDVDSNADVDVCS